VLHTITGGFHVLAYLESVFGGGKIEVAGSAGVPIPDSGETTPLGGTGIFKSSGEPGIISSGSPGI
jgi:hypothetical protein